MQNIKDMGAIVRFHRKKSGLSQRGLADMAGVGKTAVFDLEQGKVTVRMDTVVKICHILNIQLTLDSPLIEQWKAQHSGGCQNAGDSEL